jgi:hypothetical protein
MQTSILSLLLFLFMFQNGGNYHHDHHEILSERYNYYFRLPPKWLVSATAGVPYFFNFSPSYLESPGVRVGVPRGGAEISIVADAESHQAGSIDKWMELDRKADGFTSIHDLRLSPDTTIKRAIEAVSLHDDGDSRHKQITQTTTIYFEFQGHLLAAYLSYNLDDPNGREYESTLLAVVQSFRPLDGVAHSK